MKSVSGGPCSSVDGARYPTSSVEVEVHVVPYALVYDEGGEGEVVVISDDSGVMADEYNSPSESGVPPYGSPSSRVMVLAMVGLMGIVVTSVAMVGLVGLVVVCRGPSCPSGSGGPCSRSSAPCPATYPRNSLTRTLN